ncbi:response regulator transcription factor [candidate division KSB1 bacterium]|nr:response regulator transcription factor [candidate division KSB1 bacterium]
MKLTALLIEDEAPARQVIRGYLKAYPDIQIVGECDNGLDAVDMIHNLRPDIVFLDIQLPELSGIEVLDRLQFLPQIIFSTAYDEYAIRAFEINAVDYLLKPYTEQRFGLCIQRVREKISQPHIAAASLMKLMQTYQQTDYPRRLLVPGRDEMVFIRVEDIDYIEAADNYISIITKRDVYLLLQRLSDLESRLDPGRFFRIHRSCIVNVEKVESIQTWKKNSVEVILYNGKKLPLSRRRVQEFKERFGI